MNAELNRAFIIFVFEYDKLKQNFGQTTETKQNKKFTMKRLFSCVNDDDDDNDNDSREE